MNVFVCNTSTISILWEVSEQHLSNARHWNSTSQEFLQQRPYGAPDYFNMYRNTPKPKIDLSNVHLNQTPSHFSNPRNQQQGSRFHPSQSPGYNFLPRSLRYKGNPTPWSPTRISTRWDKRDSPVENSGRDTKSKFKPPASPFKNKGKHSLFQPIGKETQPFKPTSQTPPAGNTVKPTFCYKNLSAQSETTKKIVPARNEPLEQNFERLPKKHDLHTKTEAVVKKPPLHTPEQKKVCSIVKKPLLTNHKQKKVCTITCNKVCKTNVAIDKNNRRLSDRKQDTLKKLEDKTVTSSPTTSREADYDKTPGTKKPVSFKILDKKLKLLSSPIFEDPDTEDSDSEMYNEKCENAKHEKSPTNQTSRNCQSESSEKTSQTEPRTVKAIDKNESESSCTQDSVVPDLREMCIKSKKCDKSNQNSEILQEKNLQKSVSESMESNFVTSPLNRERLDDKLPKQGKIETTSKKKPDKDGTTTSNASQDVRQTIIPAAHENTDRQKESSNEPAKRSDASDADKESKENLIKGIYIFSSNEIEKESEDKPETKPKIENECKENIPKFPYDTLPNLPAFEFKDIEDKKDFKPIKEELKVTIQEDSDDITKCDVVDNSNDVIVILDEDSNDSDVVLVPNEEQIIEIKDDGIDSDVDTVYLGSDNEESMNFYVPEEASTDDPQLSISSTRTLVSPFRFGEEGSPQRKEFNILRENMHAIANNSMIHTNEESANVDAESSLNPEGFEGVPQVDTQSAESSDVDIGGEDSEKNLQKHKETDIPIEEQNESTNSTTVLPCNDSFGEGLRSVTEQYTLTSCGIGDESSNIQKTPPVLEDEGSNVQKTPPELEDESRNIQKDRLETNDKLEDNDSTTEENDTVVEDRNIYEINKPDNLNSVKSNEIVKDSEDVQESSSIDAGIVQLEVPEATDQPKNTDSEFLDQILSNVESQAEIHGKDLTSNGTSSQIGEKLKVVIKQSRTAKYDGNKVSKSDVSIPNNILDEHFFDEITEPGKIQGEKLDEAKIILNDASADRSATLDIITKINLLLAETECGTSQKSTKSDGGVGEINEFLDSNYSKEDYFSNINEQLAKLKTPFDNGAEVRTESPQSNDLIESMEYEMYILNDSPPCKKPTNEMFTQSELINTLTGNFKDEGSPNTSVTQATNDVRINAKEAVEIEVRGLGLKMREDTTNETDSGFGPLEAEPPAASEKKSSSNLKKSDHSKDEKGKPGLLKSRRPSSQKNSTTKHVVRQESSLKAAIYGNQKSHKDVEGSSNKNVCSSSRENKSFVHKDKSHEKKDDKSHEKKDDKSHEKKDDKSHEKKDDKIYKKPKENGNKIHKKHKENVDKNEKKHIDKNDRKRRHSIEGIDKKNKVHHVSHRTKNRVDNERKHEDDAKPISSQNHGDSTIKIKDSHLEYNPDELDEDAADKIKGLNQHHEDVANNCEDSNTEHQKSDKVDEKSSQETSSESLSQYKIDTPESLDDESSKSTDTPFDKKLVISRIFGAHSPWPVTSTPNQDNNDSDRAAAPKKRGRPSRRMSIGFPIVQQKQQKSGCLRQRSKSHDALHALEVPFLVTRLLSQRLGLTADLPDYAKDYKCLERGAKYELMKRSNYAHLGPCVTKDAYLNRNMPVATSGNDEAEYTPESNTQTDEREKIMNQTNEKSVRDTEDESDETDNTNGINIARNINNIEEIEIAADGTVKTNTYSCKKIHRKKRFSELFGDTDEEDEEIREPPKNKKSENDQLKKKCAKKPVKSEPKKAKVKILDSSSNDEQKCSLSAEKPVEASVTPSRKLAIASEILDSQSNVDQAEASINSRIPKQVTFASARDNNNTNKIKDPNKINIVSDIRLRCAIQNEDDGVVRESRMEVDSVQDFSVHKAYLELFTHMTLTDEFELSNFTLVGIEVCARKIYRHIYETYGLSLGLQAHAKNTSNSQPSPESQNFQKFVNKKMKEISEEFHLYMRGIKFLSGSLKLLVEYTQNLIEREYDCTLPPKDIILAINSLLDFVAKSSPALVFIEKAIRQLLSLIECQDTLSKDLITARPTKRPPQEENDSHRTKKMKHPDSDKSENVILLSIKEMSKGHTFKIQTETIVNSDCTTGIPGVEPLVVQACINSVLNSLPSSNTDSYTIQEALAGLNDGTTMMDGISDYPIVPLNDVPNKTVPVANKTVPVENESVPVEEDVLSETVSIENDIIETVLVDVLNETVPVEVVLDETVQKPRGMPDLTSTPLIERLMLPPGTDLTILPVDRSHVSTVPGQSEKQRLTSSLKNSSKATNSPARGVKPSTTSSNTVSTIASTKATNSVPTNSSTVIPTVLKQSSSEQNSQPEVSIHPISTPFIYTKGPACSSTKSTNLISTKCTTSISTSSSAGLVSTHLNTPFSTNSAVPVPIFRVLAKDRTPELITQPKVSKLRMFRTSKHNKLKQLTATNPTSTLSKRIQPQAPSSSQKTKTTSGIPKTSVTSNHQNSNTETNSAEQAPSSSRKTKTSSGIPKTTASVTSNHQNSNTETNSAEKGVKSSAHSSAKSKDRNTAKAQAQKLVSSYHLSSLVNCGVAEVVLPSSEVLFRVPLPVSSTTTVPTSSTNTTSSSKCSTSADQIITRSTAPPSSVVIAPLYVPSTLASAALPTTNTTTSTNTVSSLQINDRIQDRGLFTRDQLITFLHQIKTFGNLRQRTSEMIQERIQINVPPNQDTNQQQQSPFTVVNNTTQNASDGDIGKKRKRKFTPTRADKRLAQESATSGAPTTAQNIPAQTILQALCQRTESVITEMNGRSSNQAPEQVASSNTDNMAHSDQRRPADESQDRNSRMFNNYCAQIAQNLACAQALASQNMRNKPREVQQNPHLASLQVMKPATNFHTQVPSNFQAHVNPVSSAQLPAQDQRIQRASNQHIDNIQNPLRNCEKSHNRQAETEANRIQSELRKTQSILSNQTGIRQVTRPYYNNPVRFALPHGSQPQRYPSPANYSSHVQSLQQQQIHSNYQRYPYASQNALAHIRTSSPQYQYQEGYQPALRRPTAGMVHWQNPNTATGIDNILIQNRHDSGLYQNVPVNNRKVNEPLYNQGGVLHHNQGHLLQAYAETVNNPATTLNPERPSAIQRNHNVVQNPSSALSGTVTHNRMDVLSSLNLSNLLGDAILAGQHTSSVARPGTKFNENFQAQLPPVRPAEATNAKGNPQKSSSPKTMDTLLQPVTPRNNQDCNTEFAEDLRANPPLEVILSVASSPEIRTPTSETVDIQDSVSENCAALPTEDARSSSHTPENSRASPVDKENQVPGPSRSAPTETVVLDDDDDDVIDITEAPVLIKIEDDDDLAFYTGKHPNEIVKQESTFEFVAVKPPPEDRDGSKLSNENPVKDEVNEDTVRSIQNISTSSRGVDSSRENLSRDSASSGGVREVPERNGLDYNVDMNAVNNVIVNEAIANGPERVLNDAPSPADSGISSPPIYNSFFPSMQFPELIFANRRCICNESSIFLCACHSVMYCSEECRREDWPKHRRECRRRRGIE